MTDSTAIHAIAGRFDGFLLSDIVLRRDALPALPPQVLLHAGPPLAWPLPAAIRQSAIEAILFENPAATPAQAAQLLDDGSIALQPAQDYGLVTPLAHVVSATMPLARVTHGASARYAPLVESAAPALRFGKPAVDARARLQLLSLFGRQVLAPALRTAPVPLADLVAAGLAAGEECHALTAAANTALADRLHGLSPQDRQVIRTNPGFVLPILMAACSLLLAPTALVAVGGNGQRIGYRRRMGKESDREWITAPAGPPQGTRFAGHADTPALGAIGDSAVIDFCGLGAQALAFCPALAEEWQAVLPPDLQAHRDRVLHAESGIVDLRHAQQHATAPMINLAILDREAAVGLIGRGVFVVPTALLETGNTTA